MSITPTSFVSARLCGTTDRSRVLGRHVRHLPDFKLAVIRWSEHVCVQLHEAPAPFDRLLLRLALQDGIAANHFLGLAEGTVSDGQLPLPYVDECALRRGKQTAYIEKDTGLDHFLRQLANGSHQLRLGRSAGLVVPVRFDDHHETHVTLLPVSTSNEEALDRQRISTGSAARRPTRPRHG